jgi:hypothetical protein
MLMGIRSTLRIEDDPNSETVYRCFDLFIYLLARFHAFFEMGIFLLVFYVDGHASALSPSGTFSRLPFENNLRLAAFDAKLMNFDIFILSDSLSHISRPQPE